MNQTYFIFALVVSVIFGGLNASAAFISQSNESIESGSGYAYECTGVKLDEINPEFLTKAEQLALLDNALLDSVDRYSTCISQAQSAMIEASGSANGSGANSAGEGSDNQSGSDGGGQTDANSSPQELAPLSDSDSSVDKINGAVVEVSSQDQPTIQATTQTKKANDKRSGGIVAPKDNDAIICAILYEAINSEEDLTTKTNLTTQYQDYECG